MLATSCFFFVVFFFVGNQTQTSTRPNRDRDFGSRNLGCLFTKSCRNINVQKMLRILFSLLCIKYFFFWSHRSVGLKGNLKTLKKVLRQPWNALMLQLSLSLYDKKDYFFLCKFISPEATVINLIVILRVFLVGLGNWSGSFGCFIEAIWRFEAEFNICLGKQLSVPERAGSTSLVGKKPSS